MKDEKVTNRKIEEPANEYDTVPKQQGIVKDFDFAKAFADGLTVEEARKLSKATIREWWGK